MKPYYEYNKEFIDVIEDLICQHCTVYNDTGNYLDSMALTVNRDAMLLLAEYDRIVIETCVGRRIIAHWRRDGTPEQNERKEVKEG